MAEPKEQEQNPTRDKRDRILDAAAELFASQPFHKVLLSDVAAAAAVGKGTLYLYFKSKEDLYLSLLYRGFSDLLDRMRAGLADEVLPPVEHMKSIVRDLVTSLSRNRAFAELLRGTTGLCPSGEAWDEKRLEMREIIESVIRRGIALGVFSDPDPKLTSHYIPGMVRSAVIHRLDEPDVEALTAHLTHFILLGLACKESNI